MSTHPIQTLVGRISRSVPSASIELSDSDLLTRYIRDRDESAFTELVRRHGRLVRSVCARLLDRQQDIEDAVQATWIVLVRKAGSLGSERSLAGWLHGVARRVASNLRRGNYRRALRETRVTPTRDPHRPPDRAMLHELQAMLDAAVAELPPKCHVPYVLCYFEGKSKTEVARELGWKEGTVSSRLDRARRLVRDALARRGVTLSAALSALALSDGPVAAGACPTITKPSATAAALAEACCRTVLLGWRAVAVVACAALLGAGFLSMGRPSGVADPASEPPAQAEAPRVRLDRHGDPLPFGAVARLGTIRFRHGSTVTGLAFRDDGNELVSASYDGTVRVWDAVTGREQAMLPVLGHGSIGRLSVAADGEAIVTLTYDGNLATGDIPTRRLAMSELLTGTYAVAELSPDGQRIVVAVKGSSDVHLLRLVDGKELQKFAGQDGAVVSAAFSPDGELLATGNVGGSACVWDLTTGQPLHEFDAKDQIDAVAFSPDAKILASGGAEQRLYLWDLAGGQPLGQWGSHYPTVSSISFTPDGKTIISASESGSVFLSDLAERTTRHRLWIAPDSVALSLDGETLATGHGSVIQLWDVATGNEVTDLTAGPQESIFGSDVSTDGRFVITWGASGGHRALWLWDAATGQPIDQFIDESAWRAAGAISPDGKLIASNQTLWDRATGEILHEFADVDYPLDIVRFSPDGRTLAMATERGEPMENRPRIRLWDVPTRTERHGFGAEPVHALAFAPDGQTLAAGERSGLIRIWEVATGQELRTLPGHSREPNSLAFAPDGSLLASSDFSGTVRLWNPEKGEEVYAMPGDYSRNVTAVTFAPDGRTLAIASGGHFSQDGSLTESITLLEVATRQTRLHLSGHQGWIYSVCFGKSAQTLISSGSDTTGLVWDLTLFAGADSTPELTPERFDRLWADLASDDAEEAYRAVLTLARHPESVGLLESKLAIPKAEAQRVAELIGDLNSDQFATRERASAALARLGISAALPLRAALKQSDSAEVRRRLEQLLDALSGERRRRDRAAEALGMIETAAARELLESFQPI